MSYKQKMSPLVLWFLAAAFSAAADPFKWAMVAGSL